jgi:hypothetical protein
MKTVLLLIFIQWSINSVGQNPLISKDSTEKFDTEAFKKKLNFIEFDERYSFKGIKFESLLDKVNSQVIFLTPTNFEPMYEIKNDNFLTWGVFSFDKGYMFFNKKKFASVDLTYFETSLNDKFFNKSVNYLVFMFGKNPEYFKKVSNDQYIWTGDNLEIIIKRAYVDFMKNWAVILKIKSKSLSKNYGLQNM